MTIEKYGQSIFLEGLGKSKLSRRWDPDADPIPVTDEAVPVVGWRAWYTDAGARVLLPINWMFRNHPWVPGVNTFHCALGDEKPSQFHDCGLHVYSRQEDLYIDPWVDADLRIKGVIFGAVLGWGRVIVHPPGKNRLIGRMRAAGYRLEKARIIALLEIKGISRGAFERLTPSMSHGLTNHGFRKGWEKFIQENYSREVGEYAERYEVPVIPWETAPMYVSEFGQTLTD